MDSHTRTYNQGAQRARRTRARLATNQEIPRLSVHRSLRHIYAQVIDDRTGAVLAHAHDLTVKDGKPASGSKAERAAAVGKAIAEAATAAKVSAVRFDRGSYRYHGRVASLAAAARAHGLTF